jgi:hypothetical protein
MKKKLPDSLLLKQEIERNATVVAVTDTIIELESQGYNTRIKDIMLVTGLSRSVFAKPHIRRILIEYGVVEPKEYSEIPKKNSDRKGFNAVLAEKDGYINRLLLENERMKQEIEILRGEIHLLTYRKSVTDNNDF